MQADLEEEIQDSSSDLDHYVDETNDEDDDDDEDDDEDEEDDDDCDELLHSGKDETLGKFLLQTEELEAVDRMGPNHKGLETLYQAASKHCEGNTCK